MWRNVLKFQNPYMSTPADSRFGKMSSAKEEAAGGDKGGGRGRGTISQLAESCAAMNGMRRRRLAAPLAGMRAGRALQPARCISGHSRRPPSAPRNNSPLRARNARSISKPAPPRPPAPRLYYTTFLQHRRPPASTAILTDTLR